jgi:hypothetical protein
MVALKRVSCCEESSLWATEICSFFTLGGVTQHSYHRVPSALIRHE